MKKQFSIFPVFVALLASTGCANKNDRDKWLYGEFNRGPANALKIMHIDTETESYAGFPVRLCCFVTACRGPILGTSAVIEGYGSFVLEDEMKRYAAGNICGASWAILASRGVPELPNRIDPTIALHAGDEVAVGGFFLPPLRPTPIEFADVPPSVVAGRLLAAGAAADAGSDTAKAKIAGASRGVIVPLGDYRGFMGGPAARKNTDDTYTVWGVIVSSATCWNGTTPIGTLLRVEVLPADLNEGNKAR